MSSTSKDINQSEIEYLALDFGLYPASKELRKSLLKQQHNNITIMDSKYQTDEYCRMGCCNKQHPQS